MLPFLDRKRMVGSIMAKAGKNASLKPEVMAGGGEAGELHSAAQDMLMAIQNESASDLMDAFRRMFEHCEMQPHEEVEHEEGEEGEEEMEAGE